MRLAELPDPGGATGSSVRVRMLRAPVNPADLLAIEGRYAFAIEENVPLGAEGAKIVEDIGDEIVDLQPADLVLPLERGNSCRYRMMERAGCSI